MQRYNFQFTGQRFYRIRNGRLAGQLRDVAYQGTTTDFWGSMEAVGGESTYVLGGAFNCGKAQPGQVARGRATAARPPCSAASRILNTVAGGGPVTRPQETVERALALVDRRRLHRHRRRVEQRQPALGQQHPDHQRRDPRPPAHRLAIVDGRPDRVGVVSRSGGRRTTRSRTWSAPPRRGPRAHRRPRTPSPSSGRRRRRRRGTTPPAETSIEVFAAFAPALGEAFGDGPRATDRLLFGYAEHEMRTTYLASSTGLRLRHDQPTGHVEINAKSRRPRPVGVGRAPATADFADVDVGRHGRRRSRSGSAWAERRIDLPAGRYETLLPPVGGRRPDDLRVLVGRRPRRPRRAHACSASPAAAPGSASRSADAAA